MKRTKRNLKPSATQQGVPHPIYVKGDQVHFHPIIGGPDDGKVYTIRGIGCLPGNREVAWLVGKAACVSLEALSHIEEGGA